MKKNYSVIILGGGVSGTALWYALQKYTNIKSIGLIEKHSDFGMVASHSTQNSQTLHFGDIETNYSYEKASSVSKGASYVKNYLDTFGKEDKIHSVFHKMVLAVGPEEVEILRKRYSKFKKLFPKLKILERDEIQKLEPMIVKGRPKNEPLLALWSPDGYTVDYGALSRSFIKRMNKSSDIFLNTTVTNIQKTNSGYKLTTTKGVFTCDFLACDAGSMSIAFAKLLGYGKHLSIFSVAGNFYKGPEVLKGKVYTMQIDKLPFAAVHGDPDVWGSGYTRFGPSAKVIFMLERYNYKTVLNYMKTFVWNTAGLKSVVNIGFDKIYFNYMFKNMLYDLPIIGNWLFAKNAKKIVPTIDRWSIKKDKGYGATRPQIIDTQTKSISMGEARIEGWHSVFNITPSPGASTCLANAKRDSQFIVDTLGMEYTFKTAMFDKDLSDINKK